MLRKINVIHRLGDPPPIGEGTWALLLMAMAYGAYVTYRKRKMQAVIE